MSPLCGSCALAPRHVPWWQLCLTSLCSLHNCPPTNTPPRPHRYLPTDIGTNFFLYQIEPDPPFWAPRVEMAMTGLGGQLFVTGGYNVTGNGTLISSVADAWNSTDGAVGAAQQLVCFCACFHRSEKEVPSSVHVCMLCMCVCTCACVHVCVRVRSLCAFSSTPELVTHSCALALSSVPRQLHPRLRGVHRWGCTEERQQQQHLLPE